MNRSTTCSHRLLLGAALLASLFIGLAQAQVEGSIVTKRGAVVRGVVDGNILALNEDAAVSVDPSAKIGGDLILPAERSVAAPGKGDTPPGKMKVSPRAAVNVANGEAVKGRQRAAKGFALPKPGKLKPAKGSEVVILRNGRSQAPDVSKLKDLTLKNESEGMALPPRSIALPPGDYGDIVIEEGQLILGVPRSPDRTRYTFESLTVAQNGSVALMGSVVITAGQVGVLDGTLGNSRFVNWLDLRVLSGDATLGGRMYGHLTAPAGTVTLRAGSWLMGGLVCDQATVEDGARFTGVRPSWSDEATGNARPTFMHNGARFEQRVAELAEKWADQYTIQTSYEEDVPTIDVAPVGRGGASKGDDELFLEMACALFENTRFDTGTIVLQRPGRAPALTLTLTRTWFVDAIRSLGGQADLRNAIGAVKHDPALQTAFFGKRPANPSGKQ